MLAEPRSQSEPPSRRGVCPTLRAPMQTGDGLLARLRPVGGMISPTQLQAVARLAAQHGNGQIEITARGNLQVRGLQAANVPTFATGIEALIPIETGVPIEIPPLSGLDPAELADARPIAEAIRRAIATAGLEAVLGPKVTIIIDGGGTITRDGLAADIRLRALSNSSARWQLSAGPHHLDVLASSDAPSAVVALLQKIAALGLRGRGRDLPPIDRNAVLPFTSPFGGEVDPFGSGEGALPKHRTWKRPPHPTLRADLSPKGRGEENAAAILLRDGQFATCIALPYGAAGAAALGALADSAQAAGIAEFRLAPKHGLIALCATAAIAGQFRVAAAELGFLIDPDDPRHAISACIGSEGCTSGLLPARRLAETLAQTEPDFFDGSFTLHVSGCAKGCAHPGPALLTLVGTETGAGLIIDATAKSAPLLNLPPDATPAALHRLAALWRDERALGESVASCFKRLGATRVAIAALGQGPR